VPALVGALQRAGHKGRIAAIKALAKIGDRQAIEPLVTALQDGDPCVRLSAASALSKVGPPQVSTPSSGFGCGA
jgi:HEAT repeat protein